MSLQIIGLDSIFSLNVCQYTRQNGMVGFVWIRSIEKLTSLLHDEEFSGFEIGKYGHPNIHSY